MAGLPKKYAKMGFKTGWKAYKASPGYKAKHGGTTTRRKTKVAGKKATVRRGARKLFGNMSLKGVLLGGATLAATKTAIRRFAPQLGAYTPGASAVAAGVLAQAVGIPGKSLYTYGAVDLASEAIVDLINPGGLVTLPGMGSKASAGRYQY